MVRLAQHPGIGQAQPGRRQRGERPRRVLREAPVGAVDLHLRDLDRLAAAGAHQQRDAVAVEHRALDGELLDRRRADRRRPRSGSASSRKTADEHGDQQRPAGSAQASARLMPSTLATSNMLIQPSSANSDWWAWNM